MSQFSTLTTTPFGTLTTIPSGICVHWPSNLCELNMAVKSMQNGGIVCLNRLFRLYYFQTMCLVYEPRNYAGHVVFPSQMQ